jgi:drug/metabolite transporter (DMT)-like permease
MKLKIWLALIAVYICWGSTYLAIRFAVETIPPFLMAGIRFLIAGCILYAWRRLSGDPAPSRIEWRSTAIIGGFLLVGGNGSVVWAEQKVASGITSLILAATPFFLVLIDALLPHGKRPSLLTIAGVLLGFVGMALLLVHPEPESGGLDPWGVATLILASLLWSVGSLYARDAPLPSSPLLGTGMEMLAGGVGLSILGTLTGEWSRLHPSQIAPHSMWGVAYLIVFGSLVGFAAYSWLLRAAPISLVSTYAFVNPLVAIFIGYSLGNEPLGYRTLLATAVIVGSVAMINLARSSGGEVKKEKASEVAEIS